MLPIATRIRRKIAQWRGEQPPLALTAAFFPQYRIGPHTYGVPEVYFYLNNAALSIGDYCSIAGEVGIFLGGEHHPEWVSTYPFGALWREHDHPEQPRSRGDVRIGNDVWIGRGATIMSGVTIGDGAVIGARALVVKDVPPYGIVGGNPAKLLRHRFEPELVERLLAIRWWDWSEERVRKAAPLLQTPDIRGFIEAVEAGRI
jgi:chloramphenicol O-acetyltransferase type B